MIIKVELPLTYDKDDETCFVEEIKADLVIMDEEFDNNEGFKQTVEHVGYIVLHYYNKALATNYNKIFDQW